MNFSKLLFILLVFLSSCRNKNIERITPDTENEYAGIFAIVENEKYTKLTVYSPWEGAGEVKFDYYLTPRGVKIDSLDNTIPVPVEKVICLSTTHIPYIKALGETNSIIGLSGAGFVFDSTVYRRYSENEIVDVGYGQNINYEKIVSMKPDVIFAYGVGSEVVGFANRLKDLNIPVVIIAEYLESSPLGKAEWIKFISPFFCKKAEGDSIFKHIRDNYNELRNIVDSANFKPKVMTGLPFKEQWWVPGGRSYLSNLINDAGAEYLWNENESEESFVVSVEEMIVKASNADFWVFTSGIKDLNGIVDFDQRFSIFKPFKNGNVFNSDKRLSHGGGHDIWESGVLAADVMLKDFICIFHPELLKNHQTLYYRKLE